AHLRAPESYAPAGFLQLDGATRRNLELLETLGGDRRGSLLWVLDQTASPMGARGLRDWLLYPLLDAAAIGRRLDAVEELVDAVELRASVRAGLAGIGDLERLAGRIGARTAGPRDLAHLAVARDGMGWLARFEAAERARTGITSLKVRHNRVFGYYVEVTRPNLALVPLDYERKQTLVGAERFVTPALKEHEARVLGAEERLRGLEAHLFEALLDTVALHQPSLARTADALAQVDALAALAEVAHRRAYVRPRISEAPVLRIRGGRHPVVEAVAGTRFVPNDTTLDPDSEQVLVVTGPNMGGKSTYLRQVALIALLAQMGSFAPATEAEVGLADRLFTRVGASDNLVGGESTFMVEMRETAYIL